MNIYYQFPNRYNCLLEIYSNAIITGNNGIFESFWKKEIEYAKECDPKRYSKITTCKSNIKFLIDKYKKNN